MRCTYTGSAKDRGLIAWHQADDSEALTTTATYEAPLITPVIRRASRWTRYIPTCCTFNGFTCASAKPTAAADTAAEFQENVGDNSPSTLPRSVQTPA